jgi:hypothetical protein
MDSKKCPKCGNNYPSFFTNCTDCGAVLVAETKKVGKTSTYLKIGLVLCVSVILVIFVIIPAVQYSEIFGQLFSQTESAKSITESQPITEFQLNQPVGNNDLQMTVNSAREGKNIINSNNKLFIVTVFMKNVRTSGNIQISNNDFALIDSEGTGYLLLGNGSPEYDLSPSQGSTAELIFTIPQKTIVKKIRFAFPGTSAVAGIRKVVEFVI